MSFLRSINAEPRSVTLSMGLVIQISLALVSVVFVQRCRWSSSRLQMMFGYILENLLGLVLGLTLHVLRHKQSRSRPRVSSTLRRYTVVAKRGRQCFYDCATFFTFSIQVACIVVLARLDFGISANGMGASTAEITWAISLLTMLPLTYVAFNPDLLREPVAQDVSGQVKKGLVDRREQLRFLLFTLCWVLFMYPFLSRMIETFGPSMIGGNDKVISTNDWDTIAEVCIAGVDQITSQETTAMNIFSVVGSLFICLLTVVKIIWLAIRRQHGKSRVVRYVQDRWLRIASVNQYLSIALFLAVPTLAISQLWTAFRLRSYQKEISQVSGNQDSDGQWTFGQIAAVTIFVPVMVECWFSWLYD